MDDEQIVRGLNRWMDAYIADPSAFAAEFQSVIDHIKAREGDEEPTYGQAGLALMKKLLADG